MAIALQDKTNVDAPSVDYPFGKIRDGEDSGTPVNTEVYGDFHQFFAKLLNEAGITPNGQFDNDDNGFQYVNALKQLINPDWVNLSLLGYTGVIKYKKYNNKVTLLMQISDLSGSIDNFYTLPVDIIPSNAYRLPAVVFPSGRGQYIDIQTDGSLLADAPTEVYLCFDYYLD